MLTTHPFDDDKLREECGVFGIFGHPEAAALVALGLHALQHRGQEAAGIVAYDGEHFTAHRGLGHVGDIFSNESIMQQLRGHVAMGHTRYATTGETWLRNVQPLFADFEFGGFAIGHNGNLTNAYALRRSLVKRGCLFQSTSDTEVIVHLIATSRHGSLLDRFVDALRQVDGAYSLVALTNDSMIGVRDPWGVRPLMLGRLGDAWILASETCAFDIIGAETVREVEPGELVVITAAGLQSVRPFPAAPRRPCIFELVYFGLSYPIALEGALKLKELSYIHAEGYAAGEMKHGPIALIDETVPVVVIAPPDEVFEKTASNIAEVLARGGRVVLISDAEGVARLGRPEVPALTLPKVDAFAAPILYAVPVQFLAYHAACARGTDVDQPRNLAKSVTVE
jgi:glucosamine 6-phosphate synthetase-like amidotransferase/phosphosugar isomerase protein